MNNKEKFENFLESLKGNGQDTLIESVNKGFQVCFENEGEMWGPEKFPINNIEDAKIAIEEGGDIILNKEAFDQDFLNKNRGLYKLAVIDSPWIFDKIPLEVRHEYNMDFNDILQLAYKKNPEKIKGFLPPTSSFVPDPDY